MYICTHIRQGDAAAGATHHPSPEQAPARLPPLPDQHNDCSSNSKLYMYSIL